MLPVLCHLGKCVCVCVVLHVIVLSYIPSFVGVVLEKHLDHLEREFFHSNLHYSSLLDNGTYIHVHL